MADLPAAAAWRHIEARAGFEVLFSRGTGDGHLLDGHSVGIEDGEAWSVRYAVEVDASWRTRSAYVVCTSAKGIREVRIVGDGAGGWTVDGVAAPEVAGCLDVDLEASACTNVLPVRRLALGVGERADAPAVYVRAPSLEVERLEQGYSRVGDEDDLHQYDYASPRFDFYARLVFDEQGLVVEYPGIATRIS
jgi:uncharacterized protein